MIITCASCLTKFHLDDSRIPLKGVKVRCSRCKHIFYIVPPPETKEEIIEDVESFTRYHEELLKPGAKISETPLETKPEEEKEVPEEGREKEERIEKKEEEQEERVEEIKEEEKKGFLFSEEPLKWEEKEISIEKEEELPRIESVIEKKAEAIPPRKKIVISREKRGFPRFLALLVILVIIIFGVFYLWSELGSGGRLSSYLEGPIYRIKKLWNEIWEIEKGGLIVGGLNGYEEKIGESFYFIIEGKVNNQSQYTKRHIKIKVIIFDQDKLKVAEKEAVCGRIIDRMELKKQPIEFFQEGVIIQPQTKEEMITPPDKSTPFMVIFKDLPSHAKEFKVEIVEAPNL